MPPPTPVARIDHWIDAGSFVQAYRALLLGLEAAPRDDVLLAMSSRLASALRSRGWSLGSSKATEQSEELHEIEALLRLVLRLNGEGLYGTAPDDAPPTSP